ncbi:hypothetical protein [Clostridium manihotivorum]|uniref:Uncharacterized protein n=1 Tax=Clostridium manihotivorum TaxID=2320868 RepID=A0A3R5X389_9CLOT|nr:hypothetical protein [Clostridium manihotivorum]QAA33358.1 hypothetical protein C1I91_17840 [Clostridium manihotivorum]
MEYICSFSLFLAGVIFGKLIINQNKTNYDLNLISLAVFFFVLGHRTIVFNTENISLSIAYIIPPFILGALARRNLNKIYKQKNSLN